jgi:hypothetical protein
MKSLTVSVVIGSVVIGSVVIGLGGLVSGGTDAEAGASPPAIANRAITINRTRRSKFTRPSFHASGPNHQLVVRTTL